MRTGRRTRYGRIYREFLRTSTTEYDLNLTKDPRPSPDPVDIPWIQTSVYRQGRDPEQAGSSPKSIYRIKNLDQEARSSKNLSREQKSTKVKEIQELQDKETENWDESDMYYETN
ncbi:unnamed protein product [Phytophthora fragariaefolia]|uniref:Unnamed protein product n=1 Tax=Phytophthora fragariaefolia TaxID=1490495 RepID=A0A9W7DAK1_9STRA|nr:unnamed protein product [Phytophthora fragariaefolia]